MMSLSLIRDQTNNVNYFKKVLYLQVSMYKIFLEV